MQITRFKKLKDNKYKISIKNKEDIILFDDTIVKYNLLANKILNENLYEEIINYDNQLLSYYKAIKYLGFKMRSKNEIEVYLKKQSFTKDQIEKTILKLSQEGYLDEKKYIKAFINDQINLTLNGPEKIKKQLIEQHINNDNIETELNKISGEIWQDRINKLITKKVKNNKDSRAIFLKKVKQYLYLQGYNKDDYEQILNDLNVDDDSNFMKIANNLYLKLQKKYDEEKLFYYLKNKLYAKGYSLDKINNFIIEKKESK